MAKLTIKSIKCYDTQEGPRDEIDLLVDGTSVFYQGKVDNGDGFFIGYEQTFIDSIVLDLWERDDGGWFGNDDEHLGQFSISTTPTGSDNPGIATFTQHGADYVVFYDVTLIA